MQDQLRCPQCNGELTASKAIISCTSCDFSGEEKEGIIDLRLGREDYYFNPVPRPVMKELVRDTSVEKWPDVIRGFMAAVNGNPDWIDNLVVDGRYAWKVFMNLPENAVCLDIGAGLGNLVHNLAPHVSKVYALDLTLERLQFSRLRFSLFNKNDDIQLLAGGDGTFLPFPDNSLDMVSLSGVLEWIPDNSDLWESDGSKLSRAMKMLASFFGTSNPRRIQVAFLKEIRRVLKDDGQLFIGIENRLNYEYFGGRNDHHTGLKYGSLLPRFLANLYAIYVNRQPYRTYTHSRSGYKKLLRQSGFGTSKVLGLLDGYSKLREIIPLDFEELGWKSDTGTLFNNPGRHKNHVPAYGIIAGSERAFDQDYFLKKLLAGISKSNPELVPTNLLLSKFLVTGKDKAVIFADAGNKPLVIKLPFRPSCVEGEEVNAKILTRLDSHSALRVATPRPLASGTQQSMPYFVETRCEGVSMSYELDAGNRRALGEAAFNTWKELLGTNQVTEPVVFTSQLFEDLVAASVGKLRPHVKDLANFSTMITDLKQKLVGTTVRTGLQHGDFSTGNILIANNGVSGLIDWETAREDGLPILDMINLIDSIERVCSPGIDLVDTVTSLTNHGWGQSEEVGLLKTGFELCGIDPDLQDCYAIVYWLWHISVRLDNQLAYREDQVERLINRFVELNCSVLRNVFSQCTRT